MGKLSWFCLGVAICGACGGSTAAWQVDAAAVIMGIDGSVAVTTTSGQVRQLDAGGGERAAFPLVAGAEVVAATATNVLVWDPARGALDVLDPQGTARWTASAPGAELVSAAGDERGVVAIITATGATQTLGVYEPDGRLRFARNDARDPAAVAHVTAAGEVRMSAQSSVTLVFDAAGTTVATLPSGERDLYDRDGGGLRLDIHGDKSTLVERVDAEGHVLWNKAFDKRTPTAALLSNGEAVVEVVAPEASEHSFLRIARYGMRLATTPAGEARVIGGDASGFYTFEGGELRRYEDADQ